MAIIYKICSEQLWKAAEAQKVFKGAVIDAQDGYIHFSTRSQVHETAQKHFAGQDGLVLIAVEDGRLGEELRYETSRNGDLFPHLYAALPVTAALWVKPLPLGSDGKHVFPDLDA